MLLNSERRLLSRRYLGAPASGGRDRSRHYKRNAGEDARALSVMHVLLLSSMALVTINLTSMTEKAWADSNGNTERQSLMAVPSMADDFVRAPDMNAGNLTQPRPGDFRYLKMNYATTKDQDSANENQGESVPATQSNLKATPAKANEPAPGPVTEKAVIPGVNRGDRFGSIDLSPLNLTPEQKQKIQVLRRETAKKSRELRAVLRTKREDLLIATFDPDQTESAIREKRDSVRALHQQLEDLMFEDIMVVRNLLTAEQKKHLAEIKPPARVGPSGEGPPRQDATRLDLGSKSGYQQASSVKTDATLKSDSSKSASTKNDTTAKPDATKTTASKN